MLGSPESRGDNHEALHHFHSIAAAHCRTAHSRRVRNGPPPTPVSTTETFAAGEACQFPIQVVTTGKSGFNDLPNNPQFVGIATSPTLRITVTRTAPPIKSITVNATGAFRFIALPDGNTRILAGGHNFLYGVPGVGAGALATTGPIDVLVVNNNIAAMDLSGAQVRDLCQELS